MRQAVSLLFACALLGGCVHLTPDLAAAGGHEAVDSGSALPDSASDTAVHTHLVTEGGDADSEGEAGTSCAFDTRGSFDTCDFAP